MAANYVLNGLQWFGRNRKFKAKIKYSDQILKGNIKLFGMNPDHYRDSNGHSLRISYDGGVGLGKRKVNIMNPRSRGYITDYLINFLYKELYNGIKIGYNPVQVTVNKQNYGIFLEEDFFDKYLIESNFQRESLIFEILRKDSIHFNYLGKDDLLKNLSILLSKKINDKKVKISDLINENKLIGLLALSIIANDAHQLSPINLHWYFNPVSGLMEPIFRESLFYPVKSTSIKETFSNFKNGNLIIEEFAENIPNIEKKLEFEIIRIKKSYKNLINKNEFKLYKSKMVGFGSEVDKQLKIFESNLTSFELKAEAEPIEKVKNIYIKNDTIFSKDFLIKINENLIIEKGIEININNCFLQIYGGLSVLGEEGEEVKINGKGSNATVFINSKEKIKINHARFSGFTSKEGLRSLSAGITFYESNNVIIKNSFFSNNLRGDDFLNFFRCESVELDNLEFTNVLSDAIDSDFSEISIKNSMFFNIGNDAVDASGSNIKVINCTFFNVEDKAISAGENSTISSIENKIFNSALGIVVKDGSYLNSNEDHFKNNQLDLVMFVKKPFYGYPKFTNNKSLIKTNLIEKGSELFNFNDKVDFKKNVESLLYGTVYGKSSK